MTFGLERIKLALWKVTHLWLHFALVIEFHSTLVHIVTILHLQPHHSQVSLS